MTIMSPYNIDTILFPDGQPYYSITVDRIRTLNESLAGVANSTKTTSYTLSIADRGTVIDMNSSGATVVIVPPNASVAFDIGTVISICQIGTGQVTISAGVGVTINTAASLATRAQYSTISIRQRATDQWIAAGDLQ